MVTATFDVQLSVNINGGGGGGGGGENRRDRCPARGFYGER